MAHSWRKTTPPARSFDQLAESFDRFAELVGGPLTAYLDGVLPAQGQRAVDLGCGTGHHALLLAPGFREVVAVDVSAPMLTLARSRRDRANIVYQERDLRGVRAHTDGTFDLVLSTHALHHVDDLEQTLWGIRELAAPGGRVVLVDNVAARAAVPRRWFVAQALRTLAVDLPRRRRPAAEAWELFQLSVDPAWLGACDRRPVPQPDRVRSALRRGVSGRHVHRPVPHPRDVLGRPDQMTNHPPHRHQRRRGQPPPPRQPRQQRRRNGAAGRPAIGRHRPGRYTTNPSLHGTVAPAVMLGMGEHPTLLPALLPRAPGTIGWVSRLDHHDPTLPRRPATW